MFILHKFKTMLVTMIRLFFCLVCVSVVTGNRLKHDVRKLQLETELIQHEFMELKQQLDDMQKTQDYLNSSIWQCMEESLNTGSDHHVKSNAKTNLKTPIASADVLRDPLGMQDRVKALLNGFADVKLSMVDHLDRVSSRVNGVLDTQEKIVAKLSTLEERQHDFEKLMIENITRFVEIVQNLPKSESPVDGIQVEVGSTTTTTVAMSTPLVNDDAARDCKDVLDQGKGNTTGVYTVALPITGKHMQVYCDMETEGGGWTVFQRRFDGSVEFFRNFSDYENGFGNVKEGEFWLGLSAVHELTDNTESELRIDLEDADGIMADVTFRTFVLSSGPKYIIQISEGTGSAGDREGLSYNNRSQFSTFDRDFNAFKNCPEKDRGGWWYTNCAYANLNGEYVTPGTKSEYNSGEGGMTYRDFRGFKSLKSTKMMFRRKK